ncbi:MAG: peptidoglycan editing factor PgeF [Pseudomonadota bacterium]
MTLDIITHPHLSGVKHGFFTRVGGASSGVFAGLNCGHGSSDQHEVVRINRARVAEHMGVPEDHLVGVHQVHSSNVVTLMGQPAVQLKADGMVTATKGLALGVLTADCQPVLFADMSAGIVGAAHAGWKGALNGVLAETVTAMEALGANRNRVSAVIGPAISQDNYEVGPEFRDSFVNVDPAYEAYFAQGEQDRFQFDLPAFGMAQLKALGLGHVAWTGHCTYGDPKRFYSYRRSVHKKQADYGRLIAAICL